MEEYISWEPNTIIYKFGDKSDFAYLLEEGAVEILSENEHFRRQKRRF